MADDALMVENATLRNRVRELDERVHHLEEQLVYLTTHKTLAAGISGETLISKLVNGQMTAYSASFDVVDQLGQTIEVKYSKLNVAINGRYTKRWAWGKIFGEGGHKKFDFLILIGEKDMRWSEHYSDKSSSFVIFCIPQENLQNITMSMSGGRCRAIQLTSNPNTAKSRASILYTDYQITTEDLSKMFGI
jgi:hypothetical protein